MNPPRHALLLVVLLGCTDAREANVEPAPDLPEACPTGTHEPLDGRPCDGPLRCLCLDQTVHETIEPSFARSLAGPSEDHAHYEYGPRERLTRVRFRTPAGSSEIAITWDEQGRRASQVLSTETGSGPATVTTRFEYDEQGRRVGEANESTSSAIIVPARCRYEQPCPSPYYDCGQCR